MRPTKYPEYKYSKELLEPLVRDSISMSDLFRRIGLQRNGTAFRHIKRRISELGLNSSHWTGFRSNLGKVSSQRRPAADILQKRYNSVDRQPAHKIRRALREIGREYICEKCLNIGEWNNRKLTLEINHINGDRTDDRAENLQFLCPNCHSQEEHIFRGVRLAVQVV